MLTIDKIAHYNKLRCVNPKEKFLFSILTLLTNIIFNNIFISIVILLTNSILVLFAAKIDKKIYFKMLLIPIFFLVISILTILFVRVDDGRNYLFIIKIFSREYGFRIKEFKMASILFLKSLSSVSCLYFLILTTPVVEFITILETIKLPRLLIEIMSLIYRYIFLFLEISHTIFISQDSRLGYINIKKSFNSLAKLISSLFIMILRKMDENYMAMESRAYAGGDIRFFQNEYKFSKKNLVKIITFEIFLIFLYLITKKVW